MGNSSIRNLNGGVPVTPQSGDLFVISRQTQANPDEFADFPVDYSHFINVIETVDTGVWPGNGTALSQSSVAHDLFYVTLSPGKWWLSFSGGTFLPTGGSTTGFTQGAMWLGTTAGNTSQDLYAGDTGCYSPVAPVVGTMSPLVMAGKIYDITTSSNIYLKARAVYGSQTGLLAFGHVRGHRLGD